MGHRRSLVVGFQWNRIDQLYERDVNSISAQPRRSVGTPFGDGPCPRGHQKWSGGSIGSLCDSRPGVSKRYGAIEYERAATGVRVDTEIAEPFELDLQSRRRRGQARFELRVAN